MAENIPPRAEPSPPVKVAPSFRKGALVRVRKEPYLKSTAHNNDDSLPPSYIFEGPGEVLSVKGEYAQVRWRRPVPDVWLKLDLLETWD